MVVALSAGHFTNTKEWSMPIRKIERDDLEFVSAICLRAFSEAVAPGLSEQGVETFTNVAAADSFASRMHGDNLMLVFTDAAAIQGVIELKEGRHVAMLFIEPACQRRGIGRQLPSTALEYARSDVITVRASLSSVTAYERFGFICSGAVGEFAGLVYQPMEKHLNSSG